MHTHSTNPQDLRLPLFQSPTSKPSTWKRQILDAKLTPSTYIDSRNIFLQKPLISATLQATNPQLLRGQAQEGVALRAGLARYECIVVCYWS